MEYDADSDPDPESWLALGEQERLELVQEHHEREGAELPNAVLHATIHAIVENQLAMGELRVRETLDRLRTEGLDRHDAIHAIGSVLSELIWHAARGSSGDVKPEKYLEGLTKLSAKRWRTGR